ncbi:PfkB family carbohydrate kinase [Massilia sp. METH4]|uniref:PfkB family carbohydrate kinase n=1 Tax=Massilia sp. METH4 TaxID=3123041 RepID=UPI0030CC9609
MTRDMQAIAVFGEALVDDFGTTQVVGGAPFNVARHLAGFGVPALMITRIGADANGAAVRAQFSRFGMLEAGLQTDPRRPTGRVVVEQDEHGHRFDILPDQAYDHIDADEALAALAAPGMAAPGMLYFGTLAQRGDVSRAALGSMIAAAAAPRYLDLNLRDGQVPARHVLEAIGQAHILKVNEEELQWVHAARGLPRPAGEDVLDAAAAAAANALIDAFGLRGMIVTLGPRGALWLGADGTRLHAAAPDAIEIVDTVGAGDAFSAVFLLGDRLGWPLDTTLERANAFAAAICGVRGAVPPDPAFHAGWLARWQARCRAY